MTAKKPKNPEIAYLKAKESYLRTRDVRYLVLAIGMNPDIPPEWAIQECKKYFLKSQQQNFSEFHLAPGPKLTSTDFEMLDQMCDLIAAGKSTHGAANTVTENNASKEANVKKLVRQYKKEIVEEEITYDDGIVENDKISRRLDRALERRVKSGKWGSGE